MIARRSEARVRIQSLLRLCKVKLGGRTWGCENSSVLVSQGTAPPSPLRRRMLGMISRTPGTAPLMDFESRYGDLTDEFAQMYSAEAAPLDDCVIMCGSYMAHLLEEMVRYLVTRN